MASQLLSTGASLRYARLAHQQIARAVHKTPGEVVAALGAIQAQDYLGALWSIGLRLTGATEADVERSLAERILVRTWPMRGTLHIVAADDVRWMLDLLAPRNIAGAAGRHRQLGLDDGTFARCAEVAAKALQGGGQLTREAICARWEAAGIPTTGQRGYHILWRLAQDGLICFGAREGKQQTFVLLDEWLPTTRKLSRDEALAELARRYFTSRGPATLPDYAWWSGLKVSDARAGLEMVTAQLRRVTINGGEYWMPADGSFEGVRPPDAFVLPGFDEYLLGYTDRSAVLDPVYSPLIAPGGNGVFKPTIILDGRVAGVWKREFKKGDVVVSVAPFHAFSEAQHAAVQTAIRRYRRFLGGDVRA